MTYWKKVNNVFEGLFTTFELHYFFYFADAKF